MIQARGTADRVGEADGRQTSGPRLIDGVERRGDPASAAQWASPRLGSSFSYLRLFGQASYLLPFGPQRRRWVWASGISAGTIVTGDRFIFFDDRFAAGGAYSVRGF
ncbi:MAG: BamA/TamA family outer membrane protein [bacterium]|nr:BamA/TamA family outer membrane protein [bacterium]